MSVGALLIVAGAAHALGGTTDYRLGPGDAIAIEVAGTDLSGASTVFADGTVSFPYCRTVVYSGLTVQEAEAALGDCLRKGVINDPMVIIRVESYRSQRVEVTGAVEKSGTIFLQGPTTLRALLGQAGGIEAANNGSVVVIRGDERWDVPLADLGGPGGSMLIEAGDVISVDQGQVVFLEGVGVSKPGALPYAEGMTAFQALSRAGGATQVANLQAAYVLRGGEKIAVNLRKIRNGKSADLQLLPGDQLVVPESPL